MEKELNAHDAGGSPFEVDLVAIRARARHHMEAGAFTRSNHTDHDRLIEVLNDALATEIVCVLRYKSHYYAAKGPHGRIAANEFLEHAVEEQGHADRIAERIDQLGGKVDLDPAALTRRSHTEYRDAEGLRSMVTEDLVAERVAIETYTEMVRWLGDADPTTRRLMEEILANEEEHADDMAKLLLGL